jgi:hypothetical protein
MGFLAVTSPAIASSFPPRIVWAGTVTATEGYAGTFTVQTRLVEGRDTTTRFDGHFRCRGLGCPWRNGTGYFEPSDLDSTRSSLGFFGRHDALTCVYDNSRTPPAAFRIDGRYVCYTLAPPFPSPPHVVSTGTLSLTATPQ